ncbi:MAG: hypothetical protein IJB49_02815 [Clostridia bacterium]|nr:hypothetical protein [Clostridia bacterium]
MKSIILNRDRKDNIMPRISKYRIVCTIIGVVLFLSMIAYSVYHTNYMWINEAKAQSFDTFFDYYFSRAKGEIIVAICFGIAPIIAGLFIDKIKCNKG